MNGRPIICGKYIIGLHVDLNVGLQLVQNTSTCRDVEGYKLTMEYIICGKSSLTPHDVDSLEAAFVIVWKRFQSS